MAQAPNYALPDQRSADALISAGLVSNASTTRFKALAGGRLAPRESFPWAGVIVARLPNGYPSRWFGGYPSVKPRSNG